MQVDIERDPANDQAYISLWLDASQERGLVKKTIRVTEDIFLDFDGEGRLVGIDVCSASRVLAGSLWPTG